MTKEFRGAKKSPISLTSLFLLSLGIHEPLGGLLVAIMQPPLTQHLYTIRKIRFPPCGARISVLLVRQLDVDMVSLSPFAGGGQAKGEVVVVPDGEVPLAAVRMRDHTAYARDGVLIFER